MTFPLKQTAGTQAQVARSIQRRAVALAAMQSGEAKADAAVRAGVSRGQLNRLIRPDWRPGA